MRTLALTPPPLALDPELVWLLRRAFGPTGREAFPLPDPVAAARLANDLGLTARVLGRTHQSQLERELGATIARNLLFQALHVRATNAELAASMGTVATIAERLGLAVIWLKHAALRTLGVVPDGWREARDVDVLASGRDARRLYDALIGAGYVPAAESGTEYHLPPVVNRTGACIEVHHRVWGIQVGPETNVSAETLLRAGATVQVDERPGTHVLRNDLLIAHALVHGLVQHLSSPASYAPLRALADVIDLEAWCYPSEQIHRHIACGLDLTDVAAAAEIARCLANGTSPGSLTEFPQATELLAHIVAASRDRRYRAALRVHRLREIYDDGQLLSATRRFVGLDRAARRSASADTTVPSCSERLMEAMELARGAVSYVRLRKR